MIREFLYLDTERLYSLYSQVFEGISARIVETSIAQMQTSRAARVRMLSSEEAESSNSESIQRTEDRLMHDHIYSQLEQELDSQIVDGADAAVRGALDGIPPGSLVRVTGTGEMEDPARLDQTLENFNKLGEAVAAALLTESTGSGTGTAPVRPTKPDDLRRFARARGLHQDADLLKRLQFVSKHFGVDAISVSVTPAARDARAVFRAFADKRWMRVAPEMLRALFAGQPAAGWTVVGTLTFTPGGVPSLGEQVPAVGMRDSYRQLSRATAEMEAFWAKSESHEEVILAPLAIYRVLPLRSVPRPQVNAPADSGEPPKPPPRARKRSS